MYKKKLGPFKEIFHNLRYPGEGKTDCYKSCQNICNRIKLMLCLGSNTCTNIHFVAVLHHVCCWCV